MRIERRIPSPSGRWRPSRRRPRFEFAVQAMRLRWWTVSLSPNVFQDHDGADQAAVSAAAASGQELHGGEVVAGPAESSGARRLGT
jgi:hypothetical protein